jgi:hypothetical protein
LLVAHLHAQPAAGRSDGQVPVAQSPHQVEGLSRGLLERESLGIRGDGLLDRFADLRGRPEEAVRRHQPLDALVGALEVVRVHEEPQPTMTVGKVRKHRPAEKLLPERLPESLHLPQRLRVLRTALDVADALTPKLLLEVRLPSPRRVLAPLVGQDLLRRAVGRDATRQRLHHQRRPLVMRQRPRHQESRVVVHEGRQVQPLVASEQKRENVRLPHLVGRCPLETPRSVLALRRRRLRLDESRLVQDRAHLRLAHPETLDASEQVADAPRAVFRVLLPHSHHRLLFGLLRHARPPRRRGRRLGHQCVHPSFLVSVHPIDDRRHARTEEPRQPPQAHAPRHRLLHHPHPQRQRVRLARTADRLAPARA